MVTFSSHPIVKVLKTGYVFNRLIGTLGQKKRTFHVSRLSLTILNNKKYIVLLLLLYHKAEQGAQL